MDFLYKFHILKAMNFTDKIGAHKLKQQYICH